MQLDRLEEGVCFGYTPLCLRHPRCVQKCSWKCIPLQDVCAAAGLCPCTLSACRALESFWVKVLQCSGVYFFERKEERGKVALGHVHFSACPEMLVHPVGWQTAASVPPQHTLRGNRTVTSFVSYGTRIFSLAVSIPHFRQLVEGTDKVVMYGGKDDGPFVLGTASRSSAHGLLCCVDLLDP